MTTQVYRIVFAAAILATATGARAGESAMTTERHDTARIVSTAAPDTEASASQGRAAAAIAASMIRLSLERDRDLRADGDAPSRLDCPSDVPSAPGAASIEAGYADPAAQLVWVGP